MNFVIFMNIICNTLTSGILINVWRMIENISHRFLCRSCNGPYVFFLFSYLNLSRQACLFEFKS